MLIFFLIDYIIIASSTQTYAKKYDNDDNNNWEFHPWNFILQLTGHNFSMYYSVVLCYFLFMIIFICKLPIFVLLLKFKIKCTSANK